MAAGIASRRCDAVAGRHAPPFLRPLRRGPGRDRARLAAGRGAAGAPRSAPIARRSARAAAAALRRREPSASSSCSWPAGRASWNCSTSSRSCKSSTARSCPPSYTKNKRFAFIKGDAKLLGTRRKFARHGQCGAELSELLPHLATIVDDVCIVKSMVTDVFNHGPAKLFVNTGSAASAGRAWGRGSPTASAASRAICPASSCCNRARAARAAARRCGAAAFCRRPTRACRCCSGPEPILNLANPPGVDRARQSEFFDAVQRAQRRSGWPPPAIRKSPRASPPTKWPIACRRARRS